MTKVNQNFLKLPGSYLFSEVARRISVYSAAHPEAKIIKLSIGDVTRPLAPAVIEAMHQAVTEMGTFEGFHGYGPEQGYDFLREAIARCDYQARNVDIQPGEIFVSDGAKSDCGNIGDIFGVDNVVAVCDPVYPVYVDTNAMAGRAGDYDEATGRWTNLIYMPCIAENGFIPAIPEGKADMIYLCFPNNPTGGIMERADLEALVPVLEGTDIMIVSDEIYAELTYGQHHVSPANLTQLYDRTVLVNGFSKSHAMTGWRMGYVCAPKPIVAAMTKLHQFGIMSAPTTSQYAAIEAMRNGDVDIEKMRDEYDGRRRYLVEGLRRIGLPCFEPKGAFYVFPDIRGTGLTSDEFCERFLMEEKVAVISGAAFGPGGEGFIRCCYATSMKDIAEALTRMDNFLTNLRKKQAREG